jgi:hypothetical protein
MKQAKIELEFRPSQRREPRGIDEQWAANAAEIEKWRSGDIAIPKNLDDRHPESPRAASRARPAKAHGLWLTVIVGGLSVGGLLLYLLITLSGIGPPKELARQSDVRAKSPAVDAGRVAAETKTAGSR